MSITFDELKEKLKDMDEITLLEKLEIYSEEIVDRFPDKIEEKLVQLEEEFEEEDENEDE